MKSLILARYTLRDLLRDKLGLLFLIAMPVGFVVVMNIGAKDMAERAATIALVTFFFMLIIGCAGVGSTMVDMRRSGTLKRILIMPISKTGFLLGVSLDMFARLGIMVGLVFVMMFAYGITIPGAWLDLLLALLMGVLFALALGLNFAVISKGAFSTVLIAIVTSMMIINLSDWNRVGRFEGTIFATIADHNPVYHLSRVILGIVHEGAPLSQFHPELFAIFLWIGALFVTAVALYRWRIEHML